MGVNCSGVLCARNESVMAKIATVSKHLCFMIPPGKSGTGVPAREHGRDGRATPRFLRTELNIRDALGDLAKIFAVCPDVRGQGDPRLSAVPIGRDGD